jgi:hypothetical protein
MMARTAYEELGVPWIRLHTAESDVWDASEIDFDDELDDDQLPLDEVEAREAGVLLDDPDTVWFAETGT